VTRRGCSRWTTSSGRVVSRVPAGVHQLPVYEVREPLDQVESIWDYTSEYEFLKARTGRRPKIGMPVPYGITTELDFSHVYRSRRECADALVPAIRSDIRKLVAAGCDYIQIEEPLTSSQASEDRTPDPVHRADRHQDALLRDGRRHHRAGADLPEVPGRRAPGDLYRMRLRRVPPHLAISKMSAAAEAARRLRETG
jgi:hypothetical protein